MPRTLALLYFAGGALWVFLTDRLLVWLRVPPHQILHFQTYKGLLFVLASAALLYTLLRRGERRSASASAALVELQNDIQRMNAELERRAGERTHRPESANREVESFVYAVSHDLRAPLRSLSGFTQILLENAPAGLDEKSQHYLHRIQDASERMSNLLEDLLRLSRVNSSELALRSVNLTQICADAVAALRQREPQRRVEIDIAPNMMVSADARL
ncbi:MAG TPA: histidine kinase dimerization/phospho-acceptor domain-containing protein, partial [Steroidobacter sp.]|nr:histidine kinase dimerization/phospho-acceptor domain-containing protein [Steroidobacter sp.]